MKFIISLLLVTIGFMILQNLKGIDGNYDKLFSAIGNLGQLIIGAGIFYLTWQQHKNLKYKISSDERDIIRKNYQKLKEAIRLVGIHGGTTHEAFRLFYEVLIEAELELPQDIQQYVERIFKSAHEDNINYTLKLRPAIDGGLPVGKERSSTVETHHNFVQKIIEEKPENFYSRYIKISYKELV